MKQCGMGMAVAAAAALAGVAGTAGDARAAYVATIQEVGPNVVVTGSGTINTTGLTFKPPQPGNTDTDTGFMHASGGYLGIGPITSTVVNKYTGTFTGPTGFGTTNSRTPASGSGDMFFFAKAASVIDVPAGYVSGAPLSGTITFNNTTLSALGITPGNYTWTWGAGASADSFTVAVPEPTLFGAVALAGGVTLLGRRRRR